ncbi:unnamed protein product [Fraxinus pennsylvanica]|uniref:Uncharacterized protein n=1 Tax=Fraxinus pennsylvanica TaxID=56036 RepID=A0AAD1Z472_9LAMI|nr:unnamed protein product [Fraxinus pennsylvanica]
MFLQRVVRPAMMMTRLKETTGIVGLDVVPNAREVLIGLYSKTLEEIKVVPEDEGYRKAVESFTRHRLKVCQEEEDWEVIEKRIGCGQVEELIEEAQDELKLVGHMNEWKPWGIPDDYDCEVIENDAPVPKHIPLHRPGPLPEEFYKTLELVNTGTLETIVSSPKKDEPTITVTSEWKPWGIPDDYDCEVIENDAPVPKHIPLHRPGPLPEEFYKTLELVNTGTLETIVSRPKKDEPTITVTSGESQSK